MTIIGRTTRDAVVDETKDGRKVVNFSVAVYDEYNPKAKVRVTTYINCAYWISTKVAQLLTKGTLLELSGRLSVSAFSGKDGTPKATLNCHVRSITILSKGAAAQAKPTQGSKAKHPSQQAS